MITAITLSHPAREIVTTVISPHGYYTSIAKLAAFTIIYITLKSLRAPVFGSRIFTVTIWLAIDSSQDIFGGET